MIAVEPASVVVGKSVPEGPPSLVQPVATKPPIESAEKLNPQANDRDTDN